MAKIPNHGEFIPSPTVKLMCSYGGKFHSPPLYEQLSYAGGYTKNITVDRDIKFSDIVAKLQALSDFTAERYCIKYQLPGDVLISITNEDDLENMMIEYDLLQSNISPPEKHVSLRLFILTFAQSEKLFNCGSGIPDYLFGYDDEYDYCNPKPTSEFDYESWMIPKEKVSQRSTTTCSSVVKVNRSENLESRDVHVVNVQYVNWLLPPGAVVYNFVHMPVQNGTESHYGGGGFVPVNHYGAERVVLVDGVNLLQKRTPACKVCHRKPQLRKL